jgi:hypothetical protein
VLIVARAVAALVVGIATYFFVFWVPFAFVPGVDALPMVPLLGATLCGVLAGRFVWTRSAAATSGLVTHVTLGALLAGGVGFSLGFFGSLLLTPEANQGPLLGLLITGPLGFLLGAVGGGVHWLVRGDRAHDADGEDDE